MKSGNAILIGSKIPPRTLPSKVTILFCAANGVEIFVKKITKQITLISMLNFYSRRKF